MTTPYYTGLYCPPGVCWSFYGAQLNAAFVY
jgi:hypothetical protein